MDKGVLRGLHRFGWAWRSVTRRWTHADPLPELVPIRDLPLERRRTVRDLLELIPYPGDVTFHGGYRFEMLGTWPSVEVTRDTEQQGDTDGPVQ